MLPFLLKLLEVCKAVEGDRRLIESGTALAQGLLTAHKASLCSQLEKTMHIRKLSLAKHARARACPRHTLRPGYQSRLERPRERCLTQSNVTLFLGGKCVCDKRPVSLTLVTTSQLK